MNPLNIWLSCQGHFKLDDNMAYLNALLPAIPLTQALQQLHADFSVQVLRLGMDDVWCDEQDFIGTKQGFSREVCLSLQNQAVVWARSICAHDAHAWHDIVQCGTQPLGMRLYQLPLERTEFEYAYLSPEHLANPSTQTIVSRRSCFYLQDGSPLLLTESFLPSLKNYE